MLEYSLPVSTSVSTRAHSLSDPEDDDDDEEGEDGEDGDEDS